MEKGIYDSTKIPLEFRTIIARCLLESYFEKFTYIHVQYKYIEYFSSKEYIPYEAMESITLSQLEDRFCKILKYYERKKT